jgi:hypothetical protein
MQPDPAVFGNLYFNEFIENKIVTELAGVLNPDNQ